MEEGEFDYDFGGENLVLLGEKVKALLREAGVECIERKIEFMEIDRADRKRINDYVSSKMGSIKAMSAGGKKRKFSIFSFFKKTT